MATARLLLLLLLASAAASCSAWDISIRVPTERLEDEVVAPLIHALRPLLGSGAGQLAGLPCDSWRLGVEAHNIIDWETVPAKCEGYVGHYMLGGHYRRDSAVVVDEAVAYAETLQLAGNGKEVWIFDVDETTLSNLPYYANYGFGAKPFNHTSFINYAAEGTAPALPETLRLYQRLLELGIKPVILTGRREYLRDATEKNLRQQGYSMWEKLLLKPTSALQAGAAFKSGERQKLVDAGYAIVGNIGDQWSDILGAPEGSRTFKLPDPMYYVS
ncbi:acid phosphatase 1-like [Oryza brachyantha]|uniref:Acid phosphatase n=1 Tax=Oryza brachyantha TaxID=4533 RepID=J3M4N4_ORYBR|nr:acid phosphatase 1-like [Oryza brachyantha]